MSAKTTMCVLFRDEVVDAVFVDRTVLGTQIKFMERLPRDESVFEAVGELMRSAEKTPSRVLLCVSRGSTIQRTLSYPAAAKDDLAGMIGFEAARHVPLPEDDRLLGWAVMDSSDEKQLMLNLVAARKSEIRGLIERFEQAGVPVDEVVPFSSAVAPVLAAVPTLLVLEDATHVELCLYGEGLLRDSQLISRSAPGYGPDRVVTASRQMAAKNKTWLGDEGISRIFTGGMQSSGDGLKDELGTAFGLRVHPIEVPETMASVSFDGQEPLIEALMVGTAVLEPTLNLIEDKNRKVPISKRVIIISGLCLLLGVEALAAYAFKTGSPWLQRKKVEQKIEETRALTADIQEMRDKNRVFRKQLYQLEKVCESRVSTMEMLQDVSDALPEDSYLTAFALDGEQLTLEGNSKEPDRLPELVLALPFVDTLSTSDIGKKEGDYHEFKLSVSLRR